MMTQLYLSAETFQLYAEIILISAYNNFRNPKSQIVAEILNCCRNPKLLPKSQIVAEIPNCCQNPKLLPKSQIVAEIPNCCQNPKLLPKSQIVAEISNCCQVCQNLGFNNL